MKHDSSWKLIGIPIFLWQLERDPASPASPREVTLLPCQASRRIPRCPSQLDRSPDVTEQTRVLKLHPHSNSRIHPRFPPQFEKNHETSPMQHNETRFPCIACRAIPSTSSSMKEASTSLLELQRVPKKTITNLEGPWGHCRNMKELRVPKWNRDEARFPCIGSRTIPSSPSNMTSCLTSFRELQRFPRKHHPNTRGTPSSAQQLEESSVYPKSSQDKSCCPGFDSKGMPNFHSTSKGVFSQL